MAELINPIGGPSPTEIRYLTDRRRALLLELATIEDILDLKRTKEPQHERRRQAHVQAAQSPSGQAEEGR